jgi:hypothetical protein
MFNAWIVAFFYSTAGEGDLASSPPDTLFLEGLTPGELRDPTRSGKRVYLRLTLKDVVDGYAPPLS